MVKKTGIPGWPEAASGLPDFGNPLGQLPFANHALAEGFDFVKNLWGTLPTAVPGFVVPTLDLEELDRRITDLKAVESWLTMNSNMLRATIQSLEVQRSTVAALQAMGGGRSPVQSSAATGAARPSYMDWPPAATDPAQASSAARATHAVPETPGVSPAAPAPAKRSPRPAGRKAPPLAATNAAPVPPDGTAAGWLGFLQEQFSRVAEAATSAATPSVPPGPAKTKPRGAGRPTAPPSKSARPSRSPRRPAKTARRSSKG